MESHEARDCQYGTSVQATKDGTWSDQRHRVFSVSSSEATSQFSCSKDDDYSSFLSDVIVVGAGPAGLMLA
jgi:hypothetical protein